MLASSDDRSYGIAVFGVEPGYEPIVSSVPGLVTHGRYLEEDDTAVTKAEARRAVKRRFERPLPLVLSQTRRPKPMPGQLGATLRLDKAVSLALRVRANFRVPLTVDVNRGKLERYLARLGRESRRDARDSRMFLRKLAPSRRRAPPVAG